MNNIDDIEEDALENTVIPPLGEVLAEARLAKKLTQKDASDFLRYSIAQINALENNQLDVLPQAMITRGFIRNYARYLSLNAEPLLASYKLRVPNPTPNTVHVGKSNHRVMLTKESQPWLKYILGSIVVLLFLLTWLISVEFLPKNFFSVNKSSVDVDLIQTTTNGLPPLDSAAVMSESDINLNNVVESDSARFGENELASEALPAGALNQETGQNKPASIETVNALTASTTKTEALVGEVSSNAASEMPVKPVFNNAIIATNAALQNTGNAVPQTIVADKKLPSAKSPTTPPLSLQANPMASLLPTKSSTANSATAVSKSVLNTSNIATSTNRLGPTPTAVVLKEAANTTAEKSISSPTGASIPANPNSVIAANAAPKAPLDKLTNNQQLNLSFSEQTWVQVTDKSGAIVYERILAAGAQESISATKPLSVIVGNAKATKISFMGKLVDLKPYTTANNVARVRLE